MKPLVPGCIVFLLSMVMMGNVLAEGAGLNINFPRFDLRVEYNDSVPDAFTGMEYVRDPRGLLFDVIAISQVNRDFMIDSDKHVRVEIDGYNRFVSVSVQEPEYENVLYMQNVGHLDKNILLNGICDAVGIAKRNCKKGLESTYFYRSNRSLNKDHADLIEFGVFPGSNERIYTLTADWRPGSIKSQPPVFIKIDVDRQSMQRYFERLIE